MTVTQFLFCTTPQVWIECALENIELLLIDHAHCEKKAAATALQLIHRYSHYPNLLVKLSKLAREELRHFEQVLGILKKQGIAFRGLSSSGYARGLHAHIRQSEPDLLVDTMIVNAIIEARSCERFSVLVPHLETELAKFYQGLLASEARHFKVYLDFAEYFSRQSISDRVKLFLAVEQQLIQKKDVAFRFHSGIPV